MNINLRKLFGQERQGFHAPRIFGVAALDLLGTVLIAVVIAAAAATRPASSRFHSNVVANSVIAFVVAFAALMALAVVVHWIFGVDTALNAAILGRWTEDGGRRRVSKSSRNDLM